MKVLLIKRFIISDWPQLLPLPNHDEPDEIEDSDPDDSMEDSKPRYVLILEKYKTLSRFILYEPIYDPGHTLKPIFVSAVENLVDQRLVIHTKMKNRRQCCPFL